MITNIRIFCSILLMASLYGCAVAPTRLTQTYDSVEIQLSSPDSGRYYLMSPQGRTYGLITGASGRLTFRIPSDATPQSCYAVFSEKGKSLLKGPMWFYPSIRQTYLAVAEKRNYAQRQVTENEQTQRDALSRLNQANADLGNNHAWNGRSCEAPLQAAIPPRPPAPCNSRQECAVQAHQGCFSEFLTKQLCGLVLSKFHFAPASILACNAAVERFSREEYGAEGQFNNTMALALGAVVLKSITEGDDNHPKDEGLSLLEIANIMLEIFNAKNEYDEVQTCTDRTVEREYGPLDRWMSQYGTAQAESDRQLQSCTDDQLAIEKETTRLSQATAEAPRLAYDVAQLDLQVQRLEVQQEPLTFCAVRSVPVRMIPQRTYRR